jgi:undecaprenyl diphosphate synthase
MSTHAAAEELTTLPRHLGIIMDGNGRWALNRNLARTDGHRAGFDTAKRIVLAAERAGIRYLSLYTFSTENWRRARDEVKFLLNLLGTALKNEYDFYRENGIRLVHSGDIDGLPAAIRREITRVEEDTARFDGITVNVAVNYGGRDEIVRAVKKWHAAGGNGDLTTDALQDYLDRPDIPDPDLIVRTGGELRLSNFLLWECAYSELFFSHKLWPDWDEEDLHNAIQEYQRRRRNFGGDR